MQNSYNKQDIRDEQRKTLMTMLLPSICFLLVAAQAQILSVSMPQIQPGLFVINWKVGTPAQGLFGIMTINTPVSLTKTGSGAYRPERSLTYSPSASAANVSYIWSPPNLEGFYGRDLWTLVPDDPDSTVVQRFVLYNGPLDNSMTGIIGLGFPRDRQDSSSLLLNLYRQQTIPNTLFAIWYPPLNQTTTAAEATIGGSNQVRFTGPFTTYPRFSVLVNWWNVRGSGMQVSGKGIIGQTGDPMVLDNHWPNIYLPKGIGRLMALQLSASVVAGPNNTDLYRVPAGGLTQNITFFVGGNPYVLQPSQLVDSTNTFLLVSRRDMQQNGINVWVLGLPFLRAFYTQYNFYTGEVSIAKAR